MAVKSSKDARNEKDVTSVGVDETYLKTLQSLQDKIEKLERKSRLSEASKLGEDLTFADDDLPVDDYMEDPAVFFTFSVYYSIFGDKRKGHLVSTPYKRPIRFQRLYRYHKKGKRGGDTVSVSQCIIRSKREAEWIRSHSLYGIKFYETFNEVDNIDKAYADKLVHAATQVNSMNDMSVIHRAKAEGIDIESPNVDDLRKLLMKKLAENARAQSQRQRDLQAKNFGVPKTIDLEKAAASAQGQSTDVYS